MSYLPAHLRARRVATSTVVTAPSPMPAPDLVAATREAICELKCGKLGGDYCRLFGCCPKTISETAKQATRQCPAGHWKLWLPTPIKL